MCIYKGYKIRIHMEDIIPVYGKVVEEDGIANEAPMDREPLTVSDNKKAHIGAVMEEGNTVFEVYSMYKKLRL